MDVSLKTSGLVSVCLSGGSSWREIKNKDTQTSQRFLCVIFCYFLSCCLFGLQQTCQLSLQLTLSGRHIHVCTTHERSWVHPDESLLHSRFLMYKIFFYRCFFKKETIVPISSHHTHAHRHTDTCTVQQCVGHVLTKPPLKYGDTDQCFALRAVGWWWSGERRPLTCSLTHFRDLLCAWDAVSPAPSNLSLACETLWCREDGRFREWCF